MRIVTARSFLELLCFVPLMGCGTGVYRGEATAAYSFTEPLPSGPFTYISQLGCAKQDADLNTGLNPVGGPATDDGPCINNALAKASASHPVVLVQDGASLVSGIHGPAAGHWSIVGRGAGFHGASTLFGTGFFQKAGTNDDVIVNGDAHAGCPGGYSDPGLITPGLPPPRGSDITLRDFAINGNRGDGVHGNSTSGNPRGNGTCWLMGIDLVDVNNVEISGITFFNTSTYNLRLSNVGQATVQHSLFANTGLFPREFEQQNGDGTHVNGPANDLNIHDNYYVTTDDAIALNAPEGWGGLITNVNISNSYVQQGGALMRAYTNSAAVLPGRAIPMISNVTVDNLSGSAFFCGYFGEGSPHAMPRAETIKNLVWMNSTCAADNGSILTEDVADLTFSNFHWISGVKAGGFIDAQAGHATRITLRNLTVQRPLNIVPALITVDAQPVFIMDQLSIDGLKFTGIRNRLPLLVLMKAPSYIKQIDLNDVGAVYVNVVSNPALTGTIIRTTQSVRADR